MRAAVAVVAVAVAATAAWIVIGLASPGSRLAGTNSVLLGSYVVTVPGGERVCQPGDVVPAGAADLEVFAGSFGEPGPPLELTIDGRVAGRRSGGFADGWTPIPLAARFRDAATTTQARRICLRNRGRDRVAFGGLGAAPATAARVGGKPGGGVLSMRWTAAERETWWSEAGTIAERATFGKADLGPWTPAVLLVFVWAGALGILLRSVR